MWRALLGLLSGGLLIVIGAALASDRRGIATRHVRLSMQVVRALGPRRGTDDRVARRHARFVLFDRLFGALMMVLGVVALAGGGYLLLGQLR